MMCVWENAIILASLGQALTTLGRPTMMHIFSPPRMRTISADFVTGVPPKIARSLHQPPLHRRRSKNVKTKNSLTILRWRMDHQTQIPQLDAVPHLRAIP